MTDDHSSVALSQTMLTAEERHEHAVQFVATHDITLKLKSLGITDEQLTLTRFKLNNQPGQFDFWSFRPAFIGPPEALMLAKAYCTLKWLIIDNPPGSPDKDAGWRLLRDLEIAPLVASAQEAKARHANMTQRGIAARTLYTAEDRATWRLLAATEPAIAQVKSKSRQAELIAKRLGLPESAVQTVRKELGRPGAPDS